jgi:Putative zinc-finger
VTTMSDRWTDRLSEYLDDELTPGERLELERHLLDCSLCPRVLAELREVMTDARELEDEAPARDLWPAVRMAVRSTRREPWRLTLSMPQALAASILLMVVSGLCAWLVLTRGAGPSDALLGADSSPSLTRVNLVDPKYDRAIDDLMKVLADERAHLDPKTVQVIERNLATIDRSISEARTALERDPSDAYLNRHLADQRRLKLALLREAKNLPRFVP